jgi:hypothetical protein
MQAQPPEATAAESDNEGGDCWLEKGYYHYARKPAAREAQDKLCRVGS